MSDGLREKITERIQTIQKTLDELAIELRILQGVLDDSGPETRLGKYAAKAKKKKEDWENRPRRKRRTRAEMEAYRAQLQQRSNKTKPDYEYEHEDGVKKNAYCCNTCGKVFMSTAKHLDVVCPDPECGGIHISKSTPESFREQIRGRMQVSTAPE